MPIDTPILQVLVSLQLPLVLVAVAANLFRTPLLMPLSANPARPTPFERLVRIRFDIQERVFHAGRILLFLNLILASEALAILYAQAIVPGLAGWQPSFGFYGLGFSIYALMRIERAGAPR